MESFIWLLFLSIAMLAGSFLAGNIPLAFHFSEERLNLLSTFGAGVLVGTALVVILPEGVETLYSVQIAGDIELIQTAVASTSSVEHGHNQKLAAGLVGERSQQLSHAHSHSHSTESDASKRSSIMKGEGLDSVGGNSGTGGNKPLRTSGRSSALGGKDSTLGVRTNPGGSEVKGIIGGAIGSGIRRIVDRDTLSETQSKQGSEPEHGGLENNNVDGEGGADNQLQARSHDHDDTAPASTADTDNSATHDHSHAHSDKESSTAPVHLHHHKFEAHRYIGAALAIGFTFMFLVDHVGQGSHSHHVSHIAVSDLRDTVLLQHQHHHDKKLSATIGLVVHAAADGIAMGAASASGRASLEIIVFLAIMLHKAPSAFGLCTFLLHEGYSRRLIRQHLLVFSLAAPVAAIATYIVLRGQGEAAEAMHQWTGILLLFSAGTFLYVATVHILPEIYTTVKGGGGWRVFRECILGGGSGGGGGGGDFGMNLKSRAVGYCEDAAQDDERKRD
ncbi:hypothetical protein HK102_000106 [Quaeritorhiza haematococci]|nr:hypothetical protein HK102_000106 [Quaeritorhiza haematococci]